MLRAARVLLNVLTYARLLHEPFETYGILLTCLTLFEVRQRLVFNQARVEDRWEFLNSVAFEG